MNRRDFLKDAASSSLTLAMAMGAIELKAEQQKPEEKPKTPPISCAVIGLGPQGRKTLGALAKMGAASAPVVALCDTFEAPAFLKKAQDIAPNAQVHQDYRKVLDDKSVQAVFVATPSHKHKQIVLDALAAGKHVYCEAPLAVDLAEAKEIAKAALNAKSFFQAGLQARYNMQAHHVHKFVHAGSLGQITSGRAQYHERTSWRMGWPSQERERELNWRLSKESSLGLLGEIGIHQMNTVNWFLDGLPTAVSGFSSLMAYNDGRDVPDTVQCIFEYPKNVRYSYDATLTNSFDGAYEMFFGTSAAIQLRDLRAWMFMETDAKLEGWVVFARKDDIVIGDDKAGTGIKTATGIALVADATKQLALGKSPKDVGTDVSKSALFQAVDAFLDSIRQNKKPEVGAVEGYQATVVAAKANEAALSGSRIVYQKEWFEL